MANAFDWIARFVMLVLAGMVTLSIIGAIASIPSGSIGTRIGFEPREQVAPPEASPDEAAIGEIAAEPEGLAGAPGTGVAADLAAPKERQPEEWLEAITYALIALAGLAALGCLLLWRIVDRQTRIADALAALAIRRDPL